MTQKLTESDLLELGVHFRQNKPSKMKPNPKSMKPLKKLLKMLNASFGKKATKAFLSSEFIAYLPWEHNLEKKWLILCESLPAVYSKKTKVIENLIRKKHPNFIFEIKSLHSVSITKKENSTKYYG